MAKIAYITGTFPSWSETFIAQELELLLASEDLAISPIALRPGEGELPARVHYLYERGKGGGPGTTPSSRSSRPFPPAVQRRLSLIRHGRALRDLITRLQDEGIVHVHAACGDLPALLAATAAEKLGLSYSLSVHAHDVFCPKYPDDALYGRADFIAVCNSRAYRTLLQRLPHIAPRLHLIPHGVRLENWPYRQARYLATTPFRLLFVGRLVEKKAPGHALDILRALMDQGIPASLSVIGDGPLRQSLEKDALARNLDVNFHGTVPRRLVREIMGEHHALLLTSQDTPDNDAEGIPNVILEAMAVGLPVLTNQCGSVADICTPDTALFIDSRQPETAIDHVQALLNGDPWVRDLLRNARRRITDDHDANTLIDARRLLLRLAADLAPAT